MTLFNVVYTLKCNSNLILLGQLQESDIWYHDHPNSIILKQKKIHQGWQAERRIFLYSKPALQKGQYLCKEEANLSIILVLIQKSDFGIAVLDMPAT